MSSVEQIVSKGYYSHSQAEGFIAVKNYLFVRDQQQKYLLLRFYNFGDFTANSLEFTVTQIDSTGAVLSKTAHCYDKLNLQPNNTFSPAKGIPVNEFCTDFKLQFTRVISDQFTYQVNGTEITVLYTPSPSKESGASQPVRNVWATSIKPLRRGKQALAVLCGILALLILFGLSTYRLYDRYQDALEEATQETTSHQYLP
jgi:hypothetical protein